MVYLTESQESYIVNVNDYPYSRTEKWRPDKGIVRIYGLDNNMEKINKVIYPKKYYTLSYIKSNIIPKYEYCPLCTFGKQKETTKIDSTIPIIFVGIVTFIPIILFGIKYFMGKNIES